MKRMLLFGCLLLALPIAAMLPSQQTLVPVVYEKENAPGVELPPAEPLAESGHLGTLVMATQNTEGQNSEMLIALKTAPPSEHRLKRFQPVLASPDYFFEGWGLRVNDVQLAEDKQTATVNVFPLILTAERTSATYSCNYMETYELKNGKLKLVSIGGSTEPQLDLVFTD